jgi:hypothetical protein
MFGRLIDRLPNLRALLVITFRPEFAAPISKPPNATPPTMSLFALKEEWSSFA